MSKRTEQMASVLRRATQSVLNDGLSDPRLEGAMVTVTRVRVTDDARTAVIHVSVLPEKKQKLAWYALRDAARFIRRHAAELVSIHRMPEFVFKLDTSLKKQAAVLDAIARANDEADAGDTEAPPTDDPSPNADPGEPTT